MVNQVKVTLLSCAVFALLFCTVLCTKDGDIRLIGSEDHWQGRVEIFHNNTWGTICDDYWDLREAQVICRQAGYSDAITVYTTAAFGQGTGPIWLDDVRCAGNESKITECPHNGWGVHNCLHSEDGGVACVHPDTNPTNTGSCSFDIDLCGYTNAADDDFDWTQHQNSTPSFQTGPKHDHSTGYGSYIYIETSWPRVQGEMARIISPQVNGIKCVTFYYHMKGETVCELNVYIDDGTDRKMFWTQKGEASKVWEKAVIPVRGYSSFKIVFEALVGTRHTGDIAIDDVAALTTSCDALVPANAKPTPPDLSKINSTIRLAGGNVSSAGRIEVLHNGRWGTVCGSHFHLPAAKVACRQLGFLDVESIIPCCSVHKPGKGVIWLDNLHCEGREPAITMCPHKGWGVSRCLHSQDVGVICKTKDTLKKVRLGGSDHDYEGRVEVQIGGIWGTIMDIGWDIYDSTVICRQLGYSGASAVYSAAHYGVGKGPIWLSSARCIGNETSFSQCNVTQHHIQWNGPWWWNPHRRDAGVECYNLRLTGGNSDAEGVVEIFLGSWGTICNEYFDMNAAQVICRQIGYSQVVSMKLGYNPKPTNGSDPIITRLKCNGGESALGLCQYVPLIGNIHTCTHAKDVMVKCAVPIPTGLPPGPNPGCAANCRNCQWNNKHGGVCVCDDNQDKTIKCDVTIGVNVFEITFSNMKSSSEFQIPDFKTKVAAQLNKYCTANSCGKNMSSKFTQDDIVIAKPLYKFHKQLNLQFIVLTPSRQTKTVIKQQIITNVMNQDKTLGGYSVVIENPPQIAAQKGSSTAKIVIPIVVILVVIGVVVVVFFIYRRKMLPGSGSSASQRYLHLSRDDRIDDHDDPLLTMEDEDAPISVRA